ncbi:hypothetical protein KIW84_041701 [Lathyrus oleraceus]|uniref:DNA helicase n=1 Tax=Pisum sativum TaxID=3888 RepID=A0A9D4XCC1_PEA|nr:hypothetical protein KIW84_041701 [Pisum sativum]
MLLKWELQVNCLHELLFLSYTICKRSHQLPLSTKYLSVLTRDNDWIEFLSEAQIGGYPYDTVVQVAPKEFSYPRLRLHMLTVFRGMQSKKKVGSAPFSDTLEKSSETPFPEESICVPVELFQILAVFWLEITAARETSSIKVNDIASHIADNIGAAVAATNALPLSDRVLTFHYNRQSPKHRRLITPVSLNSSASAMSEISSTSIKERIFDSQGKIVEDEITVEHHGFVDAASVSDEGPASLSKMVVVLCEQHLFSPLLRAFDMLLPSCSLLPFIRALQAFSQMSLSEASAYLGSFSARIKEELMHIADNSYVESSQTIDETKTGITIVLNSRTSVFAAANPPSGRYDDLKTAHDNIDLQTTILSRFDLIFIVKDIRMYDQDKIIASHIIKVHASASATRGENKTIISKEENWLKRYLKYCRTECHPRLSETTAKLLQNNYVKIRQDMRQQANETGAAAAIPITVRQLEAIVRLVNHLQR